MVHIRAFLVVRDPAAGPALRGKLCATSAGWAGDYPGLEEVISHVAATVKVRVELRGCEGV